MWDLADLRSFTLEQLIELAAYHGIVQAVLPDGDGLVFHLADECESMILTPKQARFYLMGRLSAVPMAERTHWPIPRT